MTKRFSDQPLPLPNPGDWLGYGAVLRLLGLRSHATIHRMVSDGRLTAYPIEGAAKHLFWRPEVLELAAARTRAGRQA